MEDIRGEEVHRRGQDEEGPLGATDAAGPNGLHEVHAGRVVLRHQAHIHDADDEGGNGDGDG